MGQATLLLQGSVVGSVCAGQGVLQALLRAAPDYWQLLQHLSATAHQDFQANSPEFPSPSLSWPAERLNFYLWSMDEVTGPKGTVAENPVCLSLCHAKGLLLAVLHMPQPAAV